MGGSGPHLFGMDTEHSPAGNPRGLEPLLDVGEPAAYLGVPVSTVMPSLRAPAQLLPTQTPHAVHPRPGGTTQEAHLPHRRNEREHGRRRVRLRLTKYTNAPVLRSVQAGRFRRSRPSASVAAYASDLGENPYEGGEGQRRDDHWKMRVPAVMPITVYLTSRSGAGLSSFELWCGHGQIDLRQ